MAETAARQYNVGDSEMLDVSQRFISQFPNYYNGFFSLDSDTFHEGFITDFTTLVEETSAIPSDNVLIDTVVSETADVHAKRKECVDSVSSVKYYIKKAANGDKGFIDQFGYNDLDNCRDSVKKMIGFMDDFVHQVNKKRDKLVEAKMPEEAFTRFETLHQELKTERREQDDAKINRITTTKQRVRQLNRVWDTMVIISDANNYAHPGDDVAKEIFALPYPTSASPAE